MFINNFIFVILQKNVTTIFNLFQPQKTFEMKVNISGTELVVLENVKTVDTHAVVLKVLNDHIHVSLDNQLF